MLCLYTIVLIKLEKTLVIRDLCNSSSGYILDCVLGNQNFIITFIRTHRLNSSNGAPIQWNYFGSFEYILIEHDEFNTTILVLTQDVFGVFQLGVL